MSIWVTADQHFGHANIVRLCKRPFDDVAHMDTTLINNWNSVVLPEQDVWCLGDFTYKGKHPAAYLSRLNGRIHLLYGNHDKPKKIQECLDMGLIAFAGYVHHLGWNNQRFWLSHYGHRVWPGSNRGVYHLYGHSHGRLPPHNRSMDVGVDVHNFFPISLQTVVDTLSNKEYYPEL